MLGEGLTTGTNARISQDRDAKNCVVNGTQAATSN